MIHPIASMRIGAGEWAVALNQPFRRCVQSITCYWSRNALSLMADPPAYENTGKMSSIVEVPQWFANGWRVKISADVSTLVHAGIPVAAAAKVTASIDA